MKTKLLVVSGPLGSGKTSLLNGLLPFVPGKKLLIVNDVGQVNVDAARLSGTDDMRPITSGCVGCKNLGELTRIATEASLAHYDWLIVEPTGVADARELRDALVPLGFEWRCLTLVNVRDFELDMSDGILAAQLDAATAIALTHADNVVDLHDDSLLPVIEQISVHALQVPLSILQNTRESALQSDQVDMLLHEHSIREVTEKQTYRFRGVRAVSIDYDTEAHVLTLTNLIELLTAQGFEIIRGKGAIRDESGQCREYDIVRGQLTIGGMTTRAPHGVFITAADKPITADQIASLGVINRKTLNGDKEVLLCGGANIEATCASIKRWCERFPDVRRSDGSLRVRCEAGMVMYLGLREQVPEELRRQAVTSYATWLLEVVSALPEAPPSNPTHAYQVASWKFMLGKILIWLVVAQGICLLEDVLQQILASEPFRLTIEGLRELTEDVRQDSATWEDLIMWPDKNAALLLNYGLQKGLLDRDQVLLVLNHGCGLVGDDPQAVSWQALVAQFAK